MDLGLDMRTGGDNSSHLLWMAPVAVSGYNLKRALTSGGPYTTIRPGLTTPSASDTGLTNGVTYYYVVTALNGSAESSSSNEVGLTPEPPPTSPINLTIDSTGRLSWNASALATAYEVKRASSPAGPFSILIDTADLTYLDSSAAAGNTYYYVVTGLNPSGESGSSNEVVYSMPSAVSGGNCGSAPPTGYQWVDVVMPAAMPAVQNLRLTDIALPQLLRVEWDYSDPGFSHHFVWTRTTGTTTVASGSTADPFLVDTAGFTPGTTYTYEVHAICDCTTVWSTYQGTDQHTHYLPTQYTLPPLQSSISVIPHQVVVSENQAIDSRLDMRRGNNKFLDHLFGSTSFRGGLFAGSAVDPSKIGRSLLKFTVPAVGANNTDFVWTGSLNTYFTGALSTTPVNGIEVDAHTLATPAGWTAATLTWSGQPGIDTDPAAMTGSASPIFDTTNPAAYWLHWGLGAEIARMAAANQPLSVRLGLGTTGTVPTDPTSLTARESADQNGSVNSWMYFAKKEYNTALASTLLYATGAYCGVSHLQLSASSIHGGTSLTGVVSLNGPAPAGGLSVSVGSSGSAVTGASVTVPAGATSSSTFTLATSAVSTDTDVTLTASGPAGGDGTTLKGIAVVKVTP